MVREKIALTVMTARSQSLGPEASFEILSDLASEC